MQTSTQIHKKKHRCVSLRPLSQAESESRTSNQRSQYSVPKSPTTAPLSKSSSPVTAKSSDSVLKSPSPEQKSSPSVMRSLNTASRSTSDSFTLFKLPLQLISKLLSPLLPSTIKRNTSSVIAPLINFNMPLTFSTVHSSNPIPCKTKSSIPCTTQLDTQVNIHCDYPPCTNFPNNITQQKEINSSHSALIYYFLCSVLLNNLNNISLCNTIKPSDSPVTSTVNPPTTVPTDLPTTNDTQTTTVQTNDIPTTTTDIPIPPTSTTPKSTTKEEPIPPTPDKPKCPSKEPVSTTPHTPGCKSDESIPPCITVPQCKPHNSYKPYLPPMHIPKPIPCKSLLPHTSNAPVICPHSPVPHLKLHPPIHSSLEIFKPPFKSTNHKSIEFNENSQDLLLKLIASLTSNITSNVLTNT